MSLWQSFIGKFKSSNPATAEEWVSDYEDYLIPEPLLRLHQQRQLLEVHFEGSRRSYQTVILAIDRQREVIWLDDLFPAQRLLEPGSRLEFVYRCGEQMLKFEAEVISLGSSLGVPGFAIVCPRELAWQARRRHTRLELCGSSALSGKIRAAHDEVRFGTIENISAGGLCILVAGSMDEHTRYGDTLPLCEFVLDGQRIQTQACVRGLSANRFPYRSTRVRLKFLTLSEEKKALIDDFVNKRSRPENIYREAA